MLFTSTNDVESQPAVDKHTTNSREDDVAVVGRQNINQL